MDALSLQTRIPDSILPFPDTSRDRMKFLFWKGIYPVFTHIQHALLKMGILRHEGRQPHVIGRLRPDRDVNHFLKFLEAKAFGNHFVAWEDDGQLIGLRRLESFERQYHIRVFKDGEVRGHYEYTPEAHPLWHLYETGIEERRDEFLSIVGDWVVTS